MHTLRHKSPLGIYPIYNGYIKIEFQIGRRLIWVMRRPEMQESQCIELADEMFTQAYKHVPQVIAVAESSSPQLIPEFWAEHDESGVQGYRLDAWSVTLTPETNSVSYYVSRNHDFSFDKPWFESDDRWRETPRVLPDLPDDQQFTVIRKQSGELCVE